MNISVLNIYAGDSKKFSIKGKEFLSSYKKSILKGTVFINKLGIASDTQSDKKHHGGENKAICAFTQEAYNFYEEKYNLTLEQCSFGENITLLDVQDRDICLGDKFQFGEAFLEVSQPRQPCYKISSILEINNFTSTVVNACKTGFYLRVLKDGFVNESSTLKLIERKYEKINIEFINRCHLNFKDNQENIKEILDCEELSLEYRKSLEKRLKE